MEKYWYKYGYSRSFDNAVKLTTEQYANEDEIMFTVWKYAHLTEEEYARAVKEYWGNEQKEGLQAIIDYAIDNSEDINNSYHSHTQISIANMIQYKLLINEHSLGVATGNLPAINPNFVKVLTYMHHNDLDMLNAIKVVLDIEKVMMGIDPAEVKDLQNIIDKIDQLVANQGAVIV